MTGTWSNVAVERPGSGALEETEHTGVVHRGPGPAGVAFAVQVFA